MTTKLRSTDQIEENVEGTLPLDAQLVHALFDRHGIEKHKRSRLVESILGLSYNAAHRRVKGSETWTFEQLDRVAQHFGETIEQLFSAHEWAKSIRATLTVGAFNAPCQALLLGPTNPDQPSQFVAYQDGAAEAGWIVTPSTDVGRPTRAVSKILLTSHDERRRSVAILDDAVDIAEGLASFFNASGYDATAFVSAHELQEAMRVRRFDAYIIDWLIGDTTARGILADIRGADQHCPVAVLTGQARSGRADVADVAAAMQLYGAHYFEKPLRAPIIAVWLSQAFGPRRRTAEAA